MANTNPYEMWTPEQWGQSGDYYKGMMNANYTVPEAWKTGQQYAGQMAKTGSPVDTPGWFQANAPVYQTQMSDWTKQMLEDAGMGGTRYGSSTGASIAEQARRLAETMGQGQYNAYSTAQENAANRQLQGIGQLFNYGQGYAGLEQGALDRGMQAARENVDLGTNYFNAPLQTAQAFQGLGQGLSDQQALWPQMLGGWVGNPQYTPTTYQPSTASNILGVVGNLPWSNILSGGGGKVPTSAIDMRGAGGMRW